MGPPGAAPARNHCEHGAEGTGNDASLLLRASQPSSHLCVMSKIIKGERFILLERMPLHKLWYHQAKNGLRLRRPGFPSYSLAGDRQWQQMPACQRKLGLTCSELEPLGRGPRSSIAHGATGDRVQRKDWRRRAWCPHSR